MEQKRIKKFTLLSQIGAGQNGEAWLAHDQILDRPVAVKIFPQSLFPDMDQLQAFIREVRMAARIKHANLITCYQADQDADNVFIVMEPVDGGSLKAYVTAQGCLNWLEATQIHLEAAKGLAAAHAASIFHGNLQPNNLLRTTKGEIKIGDLGQARLLQLTIPPAEASCYMSPEQGTGKAPDTQSDIYALVCLYYFLITGHAPYVESNENPVRDVILQRQQNQPFPDIRNEVPGTPTAIGQIIERGTHKDLRMRYRTCEELVADLDYVLQAAAKHAATKAALAKQNSEPAIFKAIPALRSWKRKSRLAAFASVVLLILSLTVYFVLPKTGEPVAELFSKTMVIKDAEPEWTSVSAIELAARANHWKKMIEGLETLSADDMYDSMYATNISSYRFSGPPGDNRTLAPPAVQLPERFILEGTLGGVRILNDHTWMAIRRSSVSPTHSTNQRYNTPVIVMFKSAQVGANIPDYKVGDDILLVVRKVNWEHVLVKTNMYRSPGNMPMGKNYGLSGTLLSYIDCLRIFNSSIMYLCFAGESMVKPVNPLSWVDANGNRAVKLSNPNDIAHTPGNFFRSFPEFIGKDATVNCRYTQVIAPHNDPARISLNVSTRLEAPFDIIATMPSGITALNFQNFTPNILVMAKLKFQTSSSSDAIADVTNLFGVQNYLRWDMIQHQFSIARNREGAKDPFTAWKAIFADCSRIEALNDKKLCVSDANAPGKRKPSQISEREAPVADPKFNIGNRVDCLGTLDSILCLSNELHCMIKVNAPEFGATHVEGFSQNREFLSGLVDYLTKRETGTQGDGVSISGIVRSPVGTAFRLAPNNPLVDLQSIERVNEPNSKVTAGSSRTEGNLIKDRVPMLAHLVRNPPEIGAALAFDAIFQQFDKEGVVSLGVKERVRGAHAKVSFPLAAQEMFSDYASNTRVHIQGEYVGLNSTKPEQAYLLIQGKAIMRPKNPHSLITSTTRAMMPMSLESEEKTYRSLYRRETNLVMNGIWGSITISNNISIITVENLFFTNNKFFHMPHAPKTFYHPPLAPENESFFKSLDAGEEIYFEAITGGQYDSSQKTRARILWVARIAEPERKVMLRSAETQ